MALKRRGLLHASQYWDTGQLCKGTSARTCSKQIAQLNNLETTVLPSRKVDLFSINPHQNDQGRKGPCYFQRLIALKCLKCQKIKKNI
jgi:hypothetical protein